MTIIETLDDIFPETIDILTRFNEIGGEELLSQRYTVYILCLLLMTYVLGWILQYDQFHQLPYVSIEPENENTDTHPYSTFGTVWALTIYIMTETVFYVTQNQPFTLTLSLLRTMLSYSILFITAGTLLAVGYIGYVIFTATMSKDE